MTDNQDVDIPIQRCIDNVEDISKPRKNCLKRNPVRIYHGHNLLIAHATARDMKLLKARYADVGEML